MLAHKFASAAEANCLAFLALVADCLVTGAHFLEGILDVEEVVYVEGALEPRDSVHWQLCDLATGWTRETLSLTSYQTLQALLAEHMEALEQLWLFVGLQTYPAGDLVLDLLESFLGSSGGFGSHDSVSTAARLRLATKEIRKSRSKAQNLTAVGKMGGTRKQFSAYQYSQPDIRRPAFACLTLNGSLTAAMNVLTTLRHIHTVPIGGTKIIHLRRCSGNCNVPYLLE